MNMLLYFLVKIINKRTLSTIIKGKSQVIPKTYAHVHMFAPTFSVFLFLKSKY